MSYKSKEEINKRSLEYYYKNRSKVLAYQTKRWSEKYKNDESFRKKRQFRDKSRKMFGIDVLKDNNCSMCGNEKDLQRHHKSYDDLSFIIVCRKCHNLIHNNMKLESLRQSLVS